MAIFQYTARNEEGQLVSERAVFQDELALRRHLRKNDLYLLSCAERSNWRYRFRGNVRLGDLIIMCRQLRTMIYAGMPLVSSLEALAELCTNVRLGEIMQEVTRSVSVGRTLAGTLGDYPNIFPEMMVALVKAGEEGGRLPETLQEASRQLELKMETRQRLISALMYPSFTLLATFGTVAAMIIWIVPVFAGIYKDLHATLPPPTLFLVWLSDLITHNAWIVLLCLATAILAFRRYYKTPDGRMVIDTWKLKLPVVGSLYRKTAAGSLTGSLSGLLESGVPLVQALQTCAQVSGNALIERSLRTVATNVTLGRRLSDELERTEQFPIMVVRMIAMAEASGNLPDVLKHIADSYVEEIEYAIRRMLTVVEPILTLIVAGIVGFVLVCLYYPIFNIGNVFINGS